MDIVFVLLLVLLLCFVVINAVNNNFNISSKNYLWLLLLVHILLTATYMIYAAFSSSDSVSYFKKSSSADDWFSLWGTGTTFIHFFAWPFTNFMGLSYYATMIIFSFFGFLGILLFYVTAKENINLKPVSGNYSYIELVFLLPNLHFWSASLGKGSTILMALAFFSFGLSRFNRRIAAMLFGGFLTYMIRPHILMTLIVSMMIGVILTSSGVKWYLRWIIFIAAAVIFYFISDKVSELADTDTLNVLASNSLTHRAAELGKATTGVDIGNYNIFMKLFTFWFRPLFFDGGGVVGIFASIENVLYLFMAFIIIKEAILHWGDWNGLFRIFIIIFFLGSIILAQVTGNLGIAMRQKAQLMPFIFIVFCKAMTYSERLVSNYRKPLQTAR